jgi:hypothetical protein
MTGRVRRPVRRIKALTYGRQMGPTVYRAVSAQPEIAETGRFTADAVNLPHSNSAIQSGRRGAGRKK